MIVKRAEAGKNYGVVMLPEGLIEFIPEFNALISDINDVLASGIPTTIGERTKLQFFGALVVPFIPLKSDLGTPQRNQNGM